MRLWWAASFSVQEARIKRANFMTSFCSLWKASAVYDRTCDDRSHCRRAAAYRQSNRRSLNVVGLRDEPAIIPAGGPAWRGSLLLATRPAVRRKAASAPAINLLSAPLTIPRVY